MKRILSFIIIISAVSLLFTACEKDITTEDTSRITNFANFTVEGEELIMHQLGTAYADPAVSAEEDGNPLEVKISVSGETTGFSASTANIDPDVMDKYVINYLATNSDGYDGGVSRTVVVGTSSDLVTSIEGVYLASAQREPAFAVTDQYTDMEYIFIRKTGENTYEITGAAGGYYYLGRDYGFDYAAQGATITANDIPANDFEFGGLPAVFPGFGVAITEIFDFVVDPDNKMITYKVNGDFANSEFHVQLKQVQF